MKPLLGMNGLPRCASSAFEKQLSSGEDNPLWRTVVLREGR
jgi:ferric iron reductase protein FhuF